MKKSLSIVVLSCLIFATCKNSSQVEESNTKEIIKESHLEVDSDGEQSKIDPQQEKVQDNRKEVKLDKNESKKEEEVFQTYGMNGLKKGSDRILHRPYFGIIDKNGRLTYKEEERIQLISGKVESIELDFLPTNEYFKKGQSVWVLSLGQEVLYAGGKELIVPAAVKNKIETIRLVKGYNYNGGGIAVEIGLKNPVTPSNAFYVLLDRPHASKRWNIRDEFSKIPMSCKNAFEPEDRKQIRPITDLNNDGKPEYYFPYEDSMEGDIVDPCGETQIRIQFMSGM